VSVNIDPPDDLGPYRCEHCTEMEAESDGLRKEIERLEFLLCPHARIDRDKGTAECPEVMRLQSVADGLADRYIAARKRGDQLKADNRHLRAELHAARVAETDSEAYIQAAANYARLQDRHEEHLRLIRKLSTDSIAPEEAEELRTQIAALVAELGTCRGYVRELLEILEDICAERWRARCDEIRKELDPNAR
jgi:hypothetical protein